MSQCVTISFFRMERLPARLWAFAMMGLARAPMARIEGLSFWKLCGSGKDIGFTPTIFPKVYAILCVWPDRETAVKRLNTERIFDRYSDHASESWSVFLRPTSSRGQWSGDEPFEIHAAPSPGSLAALTRATIRPRIALKFWGQVPSINKVIAADTNVAFKIGIGEVPFLQQVTFSIWPDTTAMANFARKDGPHARAIQAVRDGKWFKEELYARFDVTGSVGTWNGRNPLDQLDTAA